ncbi:MAG: hypothetical protein ABSF90_29870 [Syntrophobacteraceae bacterium]|jgi:hypothetical protein
MGKRIITQPNQSITLPDKDWLDLENLALAEFTSEDPPHPIESALKPGVGSGWRASEPGRRQSGCCLTSHCGSGVFI